jgi:hypothetical protein
MMRSQSSLVRRLCLEPLENRLVPSTVAGDYTDGTWRYDTSVGWSHISNLRPDNLDVDDAGNVYAVYVTGAPTDGLWRWSAATASWAKLSNLMPQQSQVTAGGVLYGDFGNQGVWRWSLSGWMKLSNLDPNRIAVSDSDALFGRFDTPGAQGLWRWTPTAGWSRLTSSLPVVLQTDSAGDCVGLFTATGQEGTWRWSPTAGWARLSTTAPQNFDVSVNGAIFENRGTGGLWYAAPGAASFTQIDSTNSSGSSLTALPDGSLYINRSDGTHPNGWHWSPARPGYGFVKLFVTDHLSSFPAVGKDGDLFFQDLTFEARGTGYWSLTSLYHLLGGPGGYPIYVLSSQR